ncbi:MAG: radical SAM protein [Candidatus Latescibacteria bacterium]|nr:radical SAM protein [bacterium]MBD3424827.1 radical SAM protein [Candidatus Latescibacterota bacterium]
MRVTGMAGRDDLATVYIAETADGKGVEFVESIQPPIPRERKWVIIISTLFGCPAGCLFCDAGRDYRGMLSPEQLFFQIDYPVRRRYGSLSVPADKFKVQFARMGEPAFNGNVLEVLEEMPSRYDAPGLLPAVSTIAPAGHVRFFRELLSIKERHYRGRFQLQFSIHSTDEAARDRLIPVPKWKLEEISDYGESFCREGDRKITLNFALAEGARVDPVLIRELFDPGKFMVKVTPVNPTRKAVENGIESMIGPEGQGSRLLDRLKEYGFQVILSVGELEENAIGSNCGQYIGSGSGAVDGSYSYSMNRL